MKSPLLDIAKMDNVDTCGMYKIYDLWPELAKKAYHSKFDPIIFDGIDHIVFVGMGGSGAIGDLFASILSKTNIHVNVVKGYLLPNTVSKNSLIVCTSISGNTVESLTVLESSKNIGCNVIAFSSGGKMESFCNRNDIPYRKIPMIHSPRSSFVNFIYSILRILESVLPIKEQDIEESILELKKLSSQISSSHLTNDNPALELAKFLTGPPCIYYPYGLFSAAIRFKSSLQENSKIHAFVEDVVEACHNGIVSWETPSNIKPILLQGTDDYIKTKERWDIIKQFFKKNDIAFKETISVNGNILSKLICLIYLLDYASIYRAILSEVDPSPVNSIDFIKERL